MVQFGQVRLRFIDRNSDGGAPGQGGGKKGAGLAGQQSGERLGTALTFAAGINVVGLPGNSLASFLTELTPTWTWFITPLSNCWFALVIEMLGYYWKSHGTAKVPPASHGRGPGRRPAPRRPLGVTVLLTLLVLGGGGWLVTAGVTYAVGYVSGNESGV